MRFTEGQEASIILEAKCSAKGLETFEIALAIVFGIIFGFSIPETLFHKRKQ